MNTSTASGICRLISRAPGHLDLEHHVSAVRQSPLDLAAKRAVPVPANVTCSRNSPSPTRRSNSAAARKWYSRPSISVGAGGPGRRRRREHEQPAAARARRGDQRALADPGRARDDEQPAGHGRRRGSASGAEEVDQLAALAVGQAADRLRLADAALGREVRVDLTRPSRGTAMSTSYTLAVSTSSGGSAMTSSKVRSRPAFRSRFSCARLTLIWFARLSASSPLVERAGGGVGQGAPAIVAGRLYPWRGVCATGKEPPE